jgi:hypothetical protein
VHAVFLDNMTPQRSYNTRASQRGMEDGNIGGVTIVERTVALKSIATGDLCKQGHLDGTVVVDHLGTSEICAPD